MKNLLHILAIVLAFIACKGNEPEAPKKKFRINPEATVKIKPAKGTAMKIRATALTPTATETTHLTALEIVKHTDGMMFYTHGAQSNVGFSEIQRDTISETPCLKMYAMDIIDRDNKYVAHFIEGYDITFRRLVTPRGQTPEKFDTIAYTPNAVIRAAETAIKDALARQDTAAVYEAFDKAFTFTPITGAEWRELKKQGKN